jgi:hypothetical protein
VIFEDEVYIVSGHKGNPEAVAQKAKSEFSILQRGLNPY